MLFVFFSYEANRCQLLAVQQFCIRTCNHFDHRSRYCSYQHCFSWWDIHWHGISSEFNALLDFFLIYLFQFAISNTFTAPCSCSSFNVYVYNVDTSYSLSSTLNFACTNNYGSYGTSGYYFTDSLALNVGNWKVMVGMLNSRWAIMVGTFFSDFFFTGDSSVMMSSDQYRLYCVQESPSEPALYSPAVSFKIFVFF